MPHDSRGVHPCAADEKTEDEKSGSVASDGGSDKDESGSEAGSGHRQRKRSKRRSASGDLAAETQRILRGEVDAMRRPLLIWAHAADEQGGLGCFSQLIWLMDAALNAAQCKTGWLAAESAMRDCIGQGAPPEIKPLSGVLERLKSRAAAIAARWALASLLAPATATETLSHQLSCGCVGRLSIIGRCSHLLLPMRMKTSWWWMRTTW